MIEWIITSSVLILIVVVLRYILKGKISLRLQYALWGLVLLRLLVPFSIGNSSISVMNVADRVAKEVTWYRTEEPFVENAYWSHKNVQEILQHNYETGRVHILNNEDSNVTAVADETVLSQTDKAIDAAVTLKNVLICAWAGGMLVVGIWFAAVNIRFALRMRKDRHLFGTKNDCAFPIYVSSNIETPCVYGFLSLKIYVTPETIKDEKVLKCVLEHETTHYRHGDHIWCVLRVLAIIIHWYNPLVWLVAYLSRVDSELACDEGTIRRIGETERQEYGRTLISMTCRKRSDLLVTATMMSGTKKNIRERIILIAKKPKTALYSFIAVVIIAIAAIGCTFTGAEERGNTIENSVVQNEESMPTGSVATENAGKTQTVAPANNSSAQKLTYEWKIKDGVLIFSGTGTIQRGDYLDEEFNSVVINEGITSIGPGAFSECDKLEKVVMPDSIIRIEPWAFLECDKLSEIEFSENCTELGINAFEGTKWLEAARKEADVVVNGVLVAPKKVVKAKEPDVDPIRVIYGTDGSIYHKYALKLSVPFEKLEVDTEEFSLGTEILYVYNYGGLSLTLCRPGWPAEDTYVTKLPADVEMISDLINTYEWTQVDSIDIEGYDYQVIAASAGVSKYMSFYDIGSGAVDYFDGVKHTYWVAEGLKDSSTTIAKEMRKIYDAFEASIDNIEIFGDYADEAASYFAKTGYTQHLAALTLGNCYKYNTCRVTDWGITLIEDNRRVSGWMEIEYTWEPFGEKYGNCLEFVLENDGNEWHCTELTAEE